MTPSANPPPRVWSPLRKCVRSIEKSFTAPSLRTPGLAHAVRRDVHGWESGRKWCVRHVGEGVWSVETSVVDSARGRRPVNQRHAVDVPPHSTIEFRCGPWSTTESIALCCQRQGGMRRTRVSLSTRSTRSAPRTSAAAPEPKELVRLRLAHWSCLAGGDDEW